MSLSVEQAREKAIRECIAWLHGQASEMNDPHAKGVLNSAAFALGQDRLRGPTPSPVASVAERRETIGNGFPLTDEQSAGIDALIQSHPEMVVTAAILVEDLIVTVERPGRHGNCINWLNWLKQPHRDQGFMTSHGRFVDRLEAAKIAEAAGQTRPRTLCGDQLFSEDVWGEHG